MKMRRLFLFAFCLVIFIATTKCADTTAEHATELVDPVEEVDSTEEEDPAPRPIRASAAATTPRKRRRGRKNGNDNVRSKVQKRRLAATFRPTRAPLFEASPPDPYMDSGVVGPTSHYGHSHSPPTRDPYYSPSKFERERKRQRIKLASEAPLVPLPQNSFDDPGPAVLRSPVFQKTPDKNYAFAYAVGDGNEAEDFSHKQARDGPITIGEYRITLPDGRTQVVRYTAGGTHGYKADVSYEPSSENTLPAAGPSSGFRHHKQYHEPVQPTHHLSATPSPSYNSNRVIKSRPLKNIALHTNEDVEYSPGSSQDDDYSAPKLSPKIRQKGGGILIPSPSPTGDYLNSISTTPTPRPNSIYDKISPFRGGKYSGSEELAYAHEHSPRAGPARTKAKQSKHVPKQVTSTAASFYDSPSPSPYPHKATILPQVTTKKYKNHGVLPYSHQPQANHLNEYVRPQKHIQYLQETPIHHQHIHHQPHPTPLIAKPLKDHSQHLVQLDHYKSGPVQVSYAPQKVKKLKKHKHGIHNHHGQYLLQAEVTPQTPITPYHHTTPASYFPKEPFHYYNSFHQTHSGFGQISASPTPTSSVTHSESPFPSAYPVTAYSTGPGPTGATQPRMRLPSPSSTAGHGYHETTGLGERPTRLGVKEVLARLPSRELSTPKTTIHPYEVGAVDYGKGVAYGNSQHDKGYPDTHYGTGNFDSELHTGLDNLDPTNSLFTGSSPSTGLGFQSDHQNIGYYPHDVSEQFNFLDGFHNFDIEQASVREIRQPRPARTNGRLSRRINRRPDKRRGVPASSAEPSKEEREVSKMPTSSSPRPPVRQRQRQRQPMRTAPPSRTVPRSIKPSQQPPAPPSTTARTRGRRRRMRTQQPEKDTMMQAVESRRPRTRSRASSSNN